VAVTPLHAKMYLLAPVVLFFAAQATADAVSDLQDKGRAAINAQLAKSTTCTKDKLLVRQEWYNHLRAYEITDLYTDVILGAT
jgi:tyrosinase